MSNYQALIFDIDGTLWDACDFCAIAWNDALTNLGFSQKIISGDDLRRVCGMTPDQYAPLLLGGIAPESWSGIIDLAHALEHKSLFSTQQSFLYQGVLDGLAQLSLRYEIGIVSNCQVDYLEKLVSALAPQVRIVDAECYGRAGIGKADNIRMISQRQGWSCAAYIGDTAGDELSAAAAKVDFYLAKYGFGEARHPCAEFDSFPALVEYFLSEDLLGART